MNLSFRVTASPSLNRLKHWRTKWRWKKKYQEELSGYALLAPKEKMKAIVTMQRFGPKELDVDNYHGGCKQLIDSLRYSGLIVDDNQEWAKFIWLDQVKCKKHEERLEVNIEWIKD